MLLGITVRPSVSHTSRCSPPLENGGRWQSTFLPWSGFWESMQTNTITGIVTVIAFRRQRFAGSLGIVAETPANTMQLNPGLHYAVSAGENYGKSPSMGALRRAIASKPANAGWHWAC